jgi:hypothetical protein
VYLFWRCDLCFLFSVGLLLECFIELWIFQRHRSEIQWLYEQRSETEFATAKASLTITAAEG